MQDWKIVVVVMVVVVVVVVAVVVVTDLNLPNLKFDGLPMRVSIARFR